MKLNKEVCRVCRLQIFNGIINTKSWLLHNCGSPMLDNLNDFQKASANWTNVDDRLWDERGEVACVLKYRFEGSSYLKVNDLECIPDECPYKLEHIVTEGTKND